MNIIARGQKVLGLMMQQEEGKGLQEVQVKLETVNGQLDLRFLNIFNSDHSIQFNSIFFNDDDDDDSPLTTLKLSIKNFGHF